MDLSGAGRLVSRVGGEMLYAESEAEVVGEVHMESLFSDPPGDSYQISGVLSRRRMSIAVRVGMSSSAMSKYFINMG